jgi:hypothetical protein
MSGLEASTLKKSFALLTTIILVMLFSFISIRIVETNLLSSNLNKLKYLHLQANIHIDSISKYIKNHNDLEIKEYKNNWQDERFSINITNDENNDSIYYTSIKTSDNSHVRLSQKIIK